MPHKITENGRTYILYDDCEEYIFIGGDDPRYEIPAGTVFVDTELTQCCQGPVIDSIPLTPTPTVTVTPSISPTATPTITPSASVTPSITPSLTASVTPTITNTPTVTPTISNTPTITPTISLTPTITPTASPTVSSSPVVSSTPTVTPTVTFTPTPTLTTTPTITPTITTTPTVTNTPTITATITPTPTTTPTITPTPALFNIPGVERLQINDDFGNPYEISSIDYGTPTDLLLNNNHTVAICVPLNNYTHRISNKPDNTTSVVDRNLLVSTDSYFTNYETKNTLNLFSSNADWNYNTYPAGRISSVMFNTELNRWFFGGQSIENEADIFLYGYKNGDNSVLFLGGSTGVGSSLNCGPTKIHSSNNLVTLINGYYIITYATTDISEDWLYYNYKALGFTCDTDINTNVCGLDWSDVPSNVSKFYEHLSTVNTYGAGTGAQRYKILNNTVPNNNLIVEGIEKDCTTESGINSTDKGYYVGSYDFGYSVSVISSESELGSNADYQIKIEFTKDVTVNLNDINLILNGRTVGRGGGANWNISGVGSTYILYLNSTIYNQAISNRKGYSIFFDLSANSLVPPYVNIPLYQANLGFSVINDQYGKIDLDAKGLPVFLVNRDNGNLIEYYVKSDTNCSCGYIYTISVVLNDPTSTPIPDTTLCVSALAGALVDSEIKCVLSKGQYIYYLVQQERDPISPSGTKVFKYNLYRANNSTPNSLELIAFDFSALRKFENLNGRDITNKWNNTSFIDDKYIIIGVPNSNSVFRINYNTLSVITAPSVVDSSPLNMELCEVTDNSCFDAFLPYNCGCILDSSATITGKQSGSLWRAFNVTYNGFQGNCDENNECYFIVTRGSNSLQYEGSDIEDWQLGEAVDIVATIGNDLLNVYSASICSIQPASPLDGQNYANDRLVLRCNAGPLKDTPGYNINNLIQNTNIDFMP